MGAYRDYTAEQLQAELEILQKQYQGYKTRKLSLNLTRGKPSPEQLDLSLPMLDLLPASSPEAYKAAAADDLRNYGSLTGIPEAKELMGAIMGVPAANVIIGGNSSLDLMYSLVSAAMTHGVLGSTPWAKLEGPIKFLCPAPGYDRHFAITEHFGIKMIPIPINADGPDMYVVERYVNTDKLVKGIWCVPKYSNPTGSVYSPQTLQRLARLFPAADDFRIYWDNAYAVHDLIGFAENDAASVASDSATDAATGAASDAAINAATAVNRSNPTVVTAATAAASGEEAANRLNIKFVCEQNGNPDIWYQFASTSKITFAGGGISALSSSDVNLQSIQKQMSFRTIGYDKLNQMRHVLFLRDINGVREHMRKHAAILKPKFDCVLSALEQGLSEPKIGEWTKPEGGYFISFASLPNTAKRTVELAKDAGVILTPAGATYPYGNDPYDSNIRIAPTYPSLEDLQLASEVFVICARLAAIEQLIAKNS